MNSPRLRPVFVLMSVVVFLGGCAERSARRDDSLAGPGDDKSIPLGVDRLEAIRHVGPGPGGGPHPEVEVVPGQCAVKIALDESIASINEKYGTKTVMQVEGSAFVILKYPVWWDAWTLCYSMEGSGDCLVAEPLYISRSPEADQGTIPFYESGHDAESVLHQDAFARIGAESALQFSTGAGTSVAILDTGVDATHPDLAGAVLSSGFDFLEDDADPSDLPDGIDEDHDGLIDEGAGHGTHVAGIVHSLAPDAAILPVRVLNSDGFGTTLSVARGIRFAAQSGVDVINLSLGLRYTSKLMKEAIVAARSQGIVIVVSAGNGGIQDPLYFPAKLEEVIAVASTTIDDEWAPFSNYGPNIDVCAPGVNILAPALDHGYAYWSGTSMSAPMVTAAAALRLQLDPWLDPNEIAMTIEDTAFPLDFDGFPHDGQMGDGRLDLFSLVLD